MVIALEGTPMEAGNWKLDAGDCPFQLPASSLQRPELQ
jgi:hypothetical protein